MHSLSLSLNPLAFCLLNVVRREECFERRRLDEKPPFDEPPKPPKPFEEGTLFCDDDDDDFDDVFVALKKEPLLLSVFFCPPSSSSSSGVGIKGMRTNARMRPTSSFSASEQKFMREALALAERAYERWEVPVGCVFVNGETNDIIARGQNKTNETRNGTKHAEVVALESATTTLPASEEKTEKKKKNDTFKDGKMDEKKSSAMDGGECAAASRVSVMEEVKVLDVYVTCEPCIMCASMLGQLPCTRKVIFGCANDKFGGGGTCLSVHEMDDAPSCADGAAMPKAYECVGGLFKDEAIELFQRFYVRGNPKAPVPHREVKEYPL